VTCGNPARCFSLRRREPGRLLPGLLGFPHRLSRVLGFSGDNQALRCRQAPQLTLRAEIISAWAGGRPAIYASGVRDNNRHRRQPAAPAVIPGLSPVPELIPPAATAPAFPRSWSPRWWVTAGGTAAVPAAPAVAWLAGARQDSVPLMIGAALLVVAVTVLNTAAVMYQARQETRRREIDQHGAQLLAAALARCIDGTHAVAAGVTGADAVAEAARVRASATRAVTTLGPAVAAMLNQHGPQPPGTGHR
jgi:hypothetical protein